LTDIISDWREKAVRMWDYCAGGVWQDTRRTTGVNIVKTLNLSVKSFLDTDLQNRASALTYNTLLAIVPALAMLFAIARGFGFSNLMKTQLFQALPAQSQALSEAFRFADSYLSHTSQEVFVGIGLIFLLWTMISLMSNIEDTMNRIWGVTTDRSLGRKVIDYTAIMFLLPILMVFSSGISIVASTVFVDNPHLKFFSPAVKAILDIAPFILTWVAFTGMYMLFPNTKVRWQNAVVSGILAGTAFQILQYLFMTGQIYVSKYNAIYGSFAFLPLLLIWLQLVWTITLAGAVLCYSSQNIFQFSFSEETERISARYNTEIAIAILTIITKRFERGQRPPVLSDFSGKYHLPIRLVTGTLNRMKDAGLINIVLSDSDSDVHAYQPAIDPHRLTIGYVMERLENMGSSGFIPNFEENFRSVISAVSAAVNGDKEASDMRLADLDITSGSGPTQKSVV
ncbi:MAG: YihY/virulence factor BrkB family protein, partial [Muribaculum sp.]|nr:YihY/virulence factor BrkB family protein [Muribaculum sp.]